jgi:hypothetical protein
MGELKLVVNNDAIEDQEAPILRTGGKGPPRSWDWLSPLAPGTMFLARPKQGPNAYIVYEFATGGVHAGNNALLIPNRQFDQPQNWFWCDPVEFCKVFELRGILEDE